MDLNNLEINDNRFYNEFFWHLSNNMQNIQFSYDLYSRWDVLTFLINYFVIHERNKQRACHRAPKLTTLKIHQQHRLQQPQLLQTPSPEKKPRYTTPVTLIETPGLIQSWWYFKFLPLCSYLSFLAKIFV